MAFDGFEDRLSDLRERYRGRPYQEIIRAARQLSLADKARLEAATKLKALLGGDEQEEQAAREIGFGPLKDIKDSAQAAIARIEETNDALPQVEFVSIEEASLGIGVREDRDDPEPPAPRGAPANDNRKKKVLALH